MVLMKKVREITGGQRMKFLGPWKMIFLRLSPGTRSYMIMNPIYQTDGVTVVIKSCILKSLKQTVVISKTLPMEKKPSPQVKSSARESRKHKKSKKSHKKKQKKRSHKKQKKNKKEVTDITADSSSEFSEETRASSTRKRKQPHKSKKKSRKKSPKITFPLGGESGTSQSEDSASSSSEDIEERDTKKTKRKKKEKSVHVPMPDPEVQERTSKRRNWKVATDARSAESSEDD